MVKDWGLGNNGPDDIDPHHVAQYIVGHTLTTVLLTSRRHPRYLGINVLFKVFD